MMMAISAELKVNWAHVLFRTLVAMVSSPGKQSPGYAVQLSILLEKLVKADLGESVSLHPMKVLNNKFFLTYMKKNQASHQDSERWLLVQFKLYEKQLQEAVDKHRAEFDKAALSANYDHMCIRFLEREQNPSDSGFSIYTSDSDSKEEHQVPDSFDLEIVYYTEKRANIEGRSNFAQTGPHPVNISTRTPIDFDIVSEFKSMKRVVAYLETSVTHMRDDQTYMKYDSKIVRQAFYRKMDEVVASVNTYKSALETNVVRKIDESHQHFANEMTLVRLQLAELVNHLKDLSDSKKRECESNSDSKEEHQVPDSFDLEIVYYTEKRANIEGRSNFAQTGPHPVNISTRTPIDFDIVSEFKSMKRVVAYLETSVTHMRDDQTYMKYDSKIVRQAFYRKMDEVVASVNTYKSALETNVVRKIDESHQHFANEMTLVRLQLAELVNHLKDLSDAKKRECESSKKRRLL
ncbi:hypothetical protein F511_38357 [Dorcoceras hygrometricum]|uniref:Uncharacterized protein n=1 Tax=Dorcoceras hygrometricum TaxID=472368 RepID=A0A2Z7B2T5_9LAMI|nr:hypothetical protein F511_38357 [Dorcoceras hygrometricum]